MDMQYNICNILCSQVKSVSNKNSIKSGMEQEEISSTFSLGEMNCGFKYEEKKEEEEP